MNPLEVVKKYMYDLDDHSRALGIEVTEVEEGRALLHLKLDSSHTNGFNIAHGGLIYTLADTAMAFASGSYGYVGVTIEGNINYLSSAKNGDTLIARAEEISRSKRIGVYQCTILNQKQEKLATAKATIFIKDQVFEESTS